MYRCYIIGIQLIEDVPYKVQLHRIVKANSKEEAEKELRKMLSNVEIDKLFIESIPLSDNSK